MKKIGKIKIDNKTDDIVSSFYEGTTLIALIIQDEEEVYDVITTNLPQLEYTDDDVIAIEQSKSKDYLESLAKQGLVFPRVLIVLPSGYNKYNLYQVTDKCYHSLDD